MRTLFLLLGLLSSLKSYGAVCSRTLTFADGSILTASQLNSEFNAITNCANALDNSNITDAANVNPKKIDAAIAGDGIARNGSTGVLSVNTDDTTIEKNSDTLRVKDSGITPAKIAANAVTTSKILDQNVTTAKIEDGAITNAKLNASIVLVPVGTILPFAGPLAPSGFLLCNGTSYLRTDYAALFAVISTYYGSSSGTTFNVPDFRGRFLRGADSGTGRDPDASSRTAMNPGGSIGDSLGSIQSDSFRSHTHSAFTLNITNTGNVSDTSSRYTQGSATTSASGGSETRPINANVNYIIKY